MKRLARHLRISVTVNAEEQRTIRTRARLHKVSVAQFVRTAALGQSPTGGTDVDGWWDGLPQTRKEQVHRWLTQPVAPAEIPGQVALDTLDVT